MRTKIVLTLAILCGCLWFSCAGGVFVSAQSPVEKPAWLAKLIDAPINKAPVVAQEATLENRNYMLKLERDGSVVVVEKVTGTSARFDPSFHLLYSPGNPNYRLKTISETRRGNNTTLGYQAVSWQNENDLFKAPEWHTRVAAISAALAADRIVWIFPDGILTAQAWLEPDGGAPILRFGLHAPSAGYYSVGYAGAPAIAPDKADWIWQPLVWQDKRFPLKSYLTEEARTTIPATLMGVDGNTVGVAADPSESPYRLPTQENSRFGVAIRNESGMAQPMLFAPVLGGPESQMAADETYSFILRLITRHGYWYDSYKSLAYQLYGFGDYRENGLTTLNQTLDNMVDFVMNDQFAYWYPEYKTNGYQNDKPGYGRQQSAVDALSLAMVRDSIDIYQRRALPTIEYVVSRNNQLFNLKAYESRYSMGGPVPDSIVDLTALYLMSGKRSTGLAQLAGKTAPTLRISIFPKIDYNRQQALDNAKEYLPNLIAMHRLTGDPVFLDLAKKASDDYIKWRLDTPQTDFYDVYSSFWTEIGPMWEALYEVYVETGERKYLEAAVEGIRQFTAYVNLHPVVPDGDVTVNIGGAVRGMRVPEESVPAWRVSANGLTTEAASTSHSHRGIFMAPYAAYLASLAYLCDDEFFTDIARAAIVGRYSNYPSYAYRGMHTTVFEKPDYPLRPFEELTFTTEHYNHPLPQTLFIIDYLVSDIFARSKGAITFPSRYTSSGAYFNNHVYGDRPGSFYGEDGVWLWLPKALLSVDNTQVNYIAGYGNGKLYLALTNQSSKPIQATLSLNNSLVAYGHTHNVQVWHENVADKPQTLVDGEVIVNLKGKGITALTIDGVEVNTELQHLYQDDDHTVLSPGSYQETRTALGKVTGMVISMSKPLTSVYVWMDATPNNLRQATLVYQVDKEWREIKDTAYPFEFTIPLNGAETEFVYHIIGETPTKGTIETPAVTLNL